MDIRGLSVVACATTLVITTAGAPSAAAQRRIVTIGTGGETGVYYEIGQSICRLINRAPGPPAMRCNAPATDGSVANVNAVRSGQMEFGIAQSDTQSKAVTGDPPFDEQGPMPELRAVFSIHTEPLAVVARDDSGIATLADLKGKRVNVGNPGSGQRATFEALSAELGWQMADYTLAGEWKAAEQAGAMCDGKVDAIVYMAGHPNAAITEATSACAAHLVPIEGVAVERLISENRYYSAAMIRKGTYMGMTADIPTFGVVATFVSSSAVDDGTVYAITKAVFENVNLLKQIHPALATLDPREMAVNGLSAPLHPGAMHYFVDKGWR